MSAAERLERLHGEMTNAPWEPETSYQGTWIKAEMRLGRDSVAKMGALTTGHGAAQALSDLRNALPEIIAVVKAAEAAAIEDADSCIRVVAALSALDAKL